MNAANNLSTPALIEYIEFYNVSLDHMDLMQEYYNWQNPGDLNILKRINNIFKKNVQEFCSRVPS
jgi:hypothetical protein